MPSISPENSPFLTPVIWTNPASTGSKWATACDQFATLAEFFISRSDKAIGVTQIIPKWKVYIADPVAQPPLMFDILMKPSLGCIRISATGLKFMTGFLALRALASLATTLQKEQANFVIKALQLPTSGVSAWFTGGFAVTISLLTLTKVYLRSLHNFEKLEKVPNNTVLNEQKVVEETD